MKEKSKSFSTNHDIDVEIDYIADHLSRITNEIVMQTKVENMR